MIVRHWGPHFPDAALTDVKHWGPHFPDGGQDPAFTGPDGPGGVATLVLDVEAGFSVTYSWVTDIHKMASGAERRASRNDTPKESYRGTALLVGNDPRAVRAKLARFAAIGGEFLLGLQHEALTLRADSDGLTVYVHGDAMARTDWTRRGQRVIVARKVGSKTSFVNAVIQDVTADSILIDKVAGLIGRVGGYIMPARPIFLEAQQNFARYPTRAEKWKLAARASWFDFARRPASLELGGVMAGLTVWSRDFGAIGNARTLELQHVPGAPDEGQLIQNAGVTLFRFKSGTTTVGDFIAAMANSTNLIVTGTPANPGATLTSFDDEFFLALEGATDAGEVGSGAAITTYAGDGVERPVWDRELQNADTADDAIHSQAKIIDHGGKPYAIATADEADWSRTIALEADTGSVDWQWWKLFLSTVRGRQRCFWLPTWREDLTFVAKAPNEITITTADESDFFAWWPAQREHIQVVETDGTITYAKIEDALDNGDGTITLTVDTTLASSSVRMISWLELCRFESDDFEVEFKATAFATSTLARVVQSLPDVSTGDPFYDDEFSAEDSQPRELVDIVHGNVAYHLTLGTRDIVYNGNVYTAIPVGRGDIDLVGVGDANKELTLKLPIDHPLVRRYTEGGTPPRTITVTLRRKQLRSGIVRQLWIGDITSMAWNDSMTEATFRVPARLGEALKRETPTVKIGKLCPYTVYDPQTCKADRNSVLFKITTPVLHVDGRIVRVNMGNPVAHGWANGGELVHLPSGEPMTVREQVYLSPGSSIANLQLQFPLVGLKVGDMVEVYAGCDRTPEQCDSRFANRHHFGGERVLPTKNPFAPERSGVEGT